MTRSEIDQAELKFLVEKNADGIIVIDGSGLVAFVNPAAERLFGRPSETLVGFPLGVPLFVSETTLVTLHRPNGEQVDLEVRVVDTTWDNCPAKLASLRDVSARQAVEEQIRHSVKMEAIGRLTAGIAHDFNNFLTVVLGNLEVAKRRAAGGDGDLVRAVGAATHAARSAASLTERLLAVARRKPLAPRLVDANAVIVGVTDLLRRTLGPKINVIADLAAAVAKVEVDPSELESALMNLAVNAQDAMPEGGTLVFRARRVLIAEDKRLDLKPGPYIEINVADTGCGMSAGVRDRAFEPFFTTKDEGRGTGLGLSRVYGFVKQSGGDVHLRSEPGKGTSVAIYFPIAEASPALSVETTEFSDANPCGPPKAATREKVLVVEDDPGVRAFLADVLDESGCDVLEAGSCAAALAAIASLEEPPRAIIIDLGLPDGSGADLAARVRAIMKDAPLILTTGGEGDAVKGRFENDDRIRVLTKPFASHTLIKTLGGLGLAVA